ncbi:MAG: hypothetical protein U0167_00570 [bacterium]
MSAPAVEFFEEPALEFRYGQRCREPHQGLSLFGPFDADAPARPGVVSHGAIGTAKGLALLRDFLSRLQWPAYRERGDPDVIRKDRYLWPTFPGLEVAFACEWPPEPGWAEAIDANALHDVLQKRDPHQRAYDACELYIGSIRRAAVRDERLGVFICVVPDEVWEACRPLSKVFGGVGERPRPPEVRIRRRQPDLFKGYSPEQYEFSVDFRRQLKARSMEYGTPLQLVRESTLRLGDRCGPGERPLTPLSDRGWNLGVGLYYKAGGKPWRLTTAREGVCYIGLAFRRAEISRDPSTACCAAQMFLDTGDGVVFRGEFGPWYSPERREFALGRAGARELLRGVLDTYVEHGGRDLREVFVHSRSRVSAEEYRGYLEACPPGVKVVGVRVRRDYETKLLRRGVYPVLRGSAWTLSPQAAFLWASGFKPDLLTYDGWEVPVPLRVDVQHGDADIRQVCRDILGLTKLNYNACKLADAQPVTVGFSDAVGEILIGNPTIRGRKPNFRFYV